MLLSFPTSGSSKKTADGRLFNSFGLSGSVRKQAREREALAQLLAVRAAILECAQALAVALARDLERCALANAVMARVLAADQPWSCAGMAPPRLTDRRIAKKGSLSS